MSDKLIISELEFDQIKQNLKNYLDGQSEFSDYNFDGAGLSILLDLLSYNTFYGGYYDNVLANEMRLHSAILRNSVVSKAKEMNYVPFSRKAPVAYLTLKAIPANPTNPPWDTKSNVTLPRGKVFTSNLENKTYDFTTLDFYILDKDGDGNYINRVDETNTPINIEVYEGTLQEMRYEVDLNNPDQKFIIPNPNCDTSTIRVLVQKSINDLERTEFFHADTFSDSKPTNNAFWIWEIENKLYDVEFGDGVLGAKLKNGNVVIIEYLTTNATEANGAFDFSLTGSIEGLSNVEVTTVNKAFGGAEIESLESIKFNAPRAYSSQDRAVTENDYKYLIRKIFPSAVSISVWGGEKNTPPQYGKVFASIKPNNGFYLTTEEKLYIQEELEKYNILTIIPELKDPDFTFIVLNSVVTYDAILSTKTSGEIQILVQDLIDNFNEDVIGKFEADYYHSQLTTRINNSDPSIVSNLTSIQLQKKFNPMIGTPASYSLEFGDAISPYSVNMTGFTVAEILTIPNSSYKIVDDGAGILQLVRSVPDTTDYVLINAGTVDYSTGKVNISNFNPITVTEVDEDNEYVLKMNVTPVDFDIATKQNTILEIIERTVTVVKDNRGTI